MAILERLLEGYLRLVVVLKEEWMKEVSHGKTLSDGSTAQNPVSGFCLEWSALLSAEDC